MGPTFGFCALPGMEGLGAQATPLAVLITTGVVGIWLNTLLFRWESTQPVSRRKLLVALAGLLVLYGAASLLGPALRMANPPADDEARVNAIESTWWPPG